MSKESDTIQETQIHIEDLPMTFKVIISKQMNTFNFYVRAGIVKTFLTNNIDAYNLEFMCCYQ
jgi:hypothetical protein